MLIFGFLISTNIRKLFKITKGRSWSLLYFVNIDEKSIANHFYCLMSILIYQPHPPLSKGEGFHHSFGMVIKACQFEITAFAEARSTLFPLLWRGPG